MPSDLKPTLSDIQPVRTQFEPGARVLVRTLSDMTPEQHRKISCAITKYAGCDVRVAVVNVARCRVTLTTPTGQTKVLAAPEHAHGTMQLQGHAAINCGSYRFADGDWLDVAYQHYLSPQERARASAYWCRWAGDSVEVVVTGI